MSPTRTTKKIVEEEEDETRQDKTAHHELRVNLLYRDQAKLQGCVVWPIKRMCGNESPKAIKY